MDNKTLRCKTRIGYERHKATIERLNPRVACIVWCGERIFWRRPFGAKRGWWTN